MQKINQATKPDDPWDWPFLMYLATVPLRRSEKAFWRMTPRKLTALGNAHARTMNPSGNKNADGQEVAQDGPWKGQPFGFADQI